MDKKGERASRGKQDKVVTQKGQSWRKNKARKSKTVRPKRGKQCRVKQMTQRKE